MCGITGWASTDAAMPPKEGDEAELSGMCGRIRHRGPDDEGKWLGNGAALGMRRLSVIDLETGEQPVWNADRTVVAVMNGEIYNFLEIREKLIEKGHIFKSRSDTEVIPHLYDEYGDSLVDHLDGMFAFALWDTRKKKLLIARDRFGEKPLYYGAFDGVLYFASELKALLGHRSVERRINPEAAHLYLSFDYVPAPLSIFAGISKLPAGHTLTWESGRLAVRKYWDLSFKKPKPKPTVEATSEHLLELLSESVRRRLISDVPLGVLLSGGIDSSTVAALAVRHSAGAVKTFSIGFEEASFDESAHAKKVAEHLGTEHFEDRLSVGTAAALVGEIGDSAGRAFVGPVSASHLPAFTLCPQTRDRSAGRRRRRRDLRGLSDVQGPQDEPHLQRGPQVPEVVDRRAGRGGTWYEHGEHVFRLQGQALRGGRRQGRRLETSSVVRVVQSGRKVRDADRQLSGRRRRDRHIQPGPLASEGLRFRRSYRAYAVP